MHWPSVRRSGWTCSHTFFLGFSSLSGSPEIRCQIDALEKTLFSDHPSQIHGSSTVFLWTICGTSFPRIAYSNIVLIYECQDTLINDLIFFLYIQSIKIMSIWPTITYMTYQAYSNFISPTWVVRSLTFYHVVLQHQRSKTAFVLLLFKTSKMNFSRSPNASQ